MVWPLGACLELISSLLPETFIGELVPCRSRSNVCLISGDTTPGHLRSSYEHPDEASVEFSGLRDGMPTAVQKGGPVTLSGQPKGDPRSTPKPRTPREACMATAESLFSALHFVLAQWDAQHYARRCKMSLAPSGFYQSVIYAWQEQPLNRQVKAVCP
ncbi:hypothetical protein E2C01_044555 [Portunus trituberculatus]|uniref:Uncharacterized protein n=1 Tax=Portunus trituberculatus TaxID=210409 RepID=A0A5B7FYQ3_PORTR|nr:hypothetical protein [Portunus trituberculatus]